MIIIHISFHILGNNGFTLQTWWSNESVLLHESDITPLQQLFSLLFITPTRTIWNRFSLLNEGGGGGFACKQNKEHSLRRGNPHQESALFFVIRFSLAPFHLFAYTSSASTPRSDTVWILKGGREGGIARISFRKLDFYLLLPFMVALFLLLSFFS